MMRKRTGPSDGGGKGGGVPVPSNAEIDDPTTRPVIDDPSGHIVISGG